MKNTRQIILLIILTITFYIAVFSGFSGYIKSLSIFIYLITLVSIIYVMMLENRSPHKSLLWIYALVFFPIIGYIYFIFSGQLEVKGHLFRNKRKHDKELLENKTTFKQSTNFEKLSDTQQSLTKLIERYSDNQVSFHTKTSILKNGDETFSSIKQSIKEAEHYIHLEYYTFRSDVIGQEMIELLSEKSKSGIEVRFIFDAVGSMSLSKKAIKQMREAGIEVHCFLPVKQGFYNQKINFRNHRKIIVVDGKVGFVGGLNIGDEYLGKDARYGFWRDTHLKIEGEAIITLQEIFLLDWAYLTGEKLLNEKYFNVDLVESDGGGTQIISSGPDSSVQGIMSDIYYELLASAKKSIYIATPYFVPNKAIRTVLSMAAKKGVEIKIIVPEKNDGFLTQYATRSYFPEMLADDIDVYMYQKGFLHEKVIIIDNKFASVGTANVDLRSLHLNFEVNALLFETESIKDLVKHYQQDIKDSIKINNSTYKNRGLILRTKESFARLFSPVL
ncbi:cardiolipin synthase [Metabacillus litoralis]|uniref:cardiolipin synthase n=1 Tax=Metabacillus litoralis TaxID=152268 RepID=UPI001CFE5679|nr:cardiolipin synthase [Metabacillus litoralis]